MGTPHDPVSEANFGPSVIQSDRVVNNAWAVARFGSPDLPVQPPAEASNIRHQYLDSLYRLQGYKFPVGMVGPSLVLDFGSGKESEEALKKLLDADPLPNEWRFSDGRQAEIRESIGAALEMIVALDSDLHRNMSIVVAGFIFARRPKLEGGSISALTGPIWLDPTDDWTTDTYVENMVHEYVHQSLFLDEMVNSIFAKFQIAEMSTPDALVRSTILKKRRPYDKAYHSAFVANVLAQLYISRGLHDKARDYLKSTRSTTDELLARPEYATPNGLASLEDLSSEVDARIARL